VWDDSEEEDAEYGAARRALERVGSWRSGGKREVRR